MDQDKQEVIDGIKAIRNLIKFTERALIPLISAPITLFVFIMFHMVHIDFSIFHVVTVFASIALAVYIILHSLTLYFSMVMSELLIRHQVSKESPEIMEEVVKQIKFGLKKS